MGLELQIDAWWRISNTNARRIHMNVAAVVAQQENVEAVVAAVKKAMSVEAVWRERADSVWNH